MNIKVLVPTGALGITYCKKALDRGLKEKPDIIVVDGGSTDSGPAYLGKGKSKYSRSSTKSEWKTLMVAREKLKIPLLIGSAGTCGTDKTVDWFLEITKELAKELNQTIKITLLKCSQSKKDINKAYGEASQAIKGVSKNIGKDLSTATSGLGNKKGVSVAESFAPFN